MEASQQTEFGADLSAAGDGQMPGDPTYEELALASVFDLFGKITINETGQAARNQVNDSLQRQVVSGRGS
jgi:hypothetical protein